jgi:hypothetical protein
MAASSSPRPDHLTSTAREPRAAVFSCTITRCADASADASVRLLEVRVDAPCSVDLPAPAHAERSFSYEAGQWCDFAAPGVATVGGFSFVSAPRVSPLAAVAARDLLPPPAAAAAAAPSVSLAVRRSAHAPAAWVHAAAAPGAVVRLRAGGRFTPSSCGLLAAVQAPGAPLPPPRAGLRHVVLVAGGVGINPLCSILLALSQWYTGDAAVPAPPAISLLYAARSAGSAALLPPLQSLASSGAYRPGGASAASLFSLQLFLSRQAAPGSVDAGGGGGATQVAWGRRLAAADIAAELDRVRRAPAGGGGGGGCGAAAAARRTRDASGETAAAELAAARAGVAVLVCGPPAMTDDVVRACVAELALEPQQVHTERWW